MAKSGFRGGSYGGGGVNMNKLRQAQKLQADMQKLQTEMEEQTFTASSGGGAVKAVVNGKRELTALEIDPAAADPEDVEMLGDMVVAAVNEAMRKVDASANERMAKLTGGLNLGF
ncbi:MAG: YbaB/EbfC family nucleoid-associated protein [Oscillospiraceae bacterium]|jgi:DNA-binding YbaB/EbfC family protein|nr:YbaB/EbfC family nucleoid-associated protein [Oscillospiraceae bacterium]